MNTIMRIKEITMSPFLISKSLYTYRELLFQMVRREIKSRFAGSIGGILWHFAHPLLLVLIYLFVFVYIFKMRVGEGGGALSALYILSGLFPWIILSEGIVRGTTSLIENANIIQKTFFPTEILPAKAVVAPFFSYGTAMVILVIYTAVFTTASKLPILMLPLVVLLQILFTLGISFITSTISVYFRDIVQIIQLITTIGVFLTPILYTTSLLPGWAANLMYFNPIYPFVSLYQFIITGVATPYLQMITLAILWSVVFFTLGAYLFNKLKYEFTDWL